MTAPSVPPDPRRATGRRGEDLAVAFLEREGYTLVARNWRTRAGEIDIVARDGQMLVFVEVRSRRSDGADAPHLGRPEDSVTPRKQIQIVRMVHAYLHDVPWNGPVRVDVIAIEIAGDGSAARLDHYCDAVGGSP